MRKQFWIGLAVLALAVPVFAQVIGPTGQYVNMNSSGNTLCLQTTASKNCAWWPTMSQYPTVTMQVSGTFTGTLTFEASADGQTWFSYDAWNLTTKSSATTTTTTGLFAFANTGLQGVRVRATAWTSGAANVILVRGMATSTARLDAAHPELTWTASLRERLAWLSQGF